VPIKLEQATLALDFLTTQRNHGRRGYPPDEKARRLAICERIRELNRKGVAA
jgi:hypothetical protein